MERRSNRLRLQANTPVPQEDKSPDPDSTPQPQSSGFRLPEIALTSNTGSFSTSEPAEDKRRRCRTTPEQLVQLEKIFATNQTPTPSRRKQIADDLGMSERQTQIWFQNRRAKEKNLTGAVKRRRKPVRVAPVPPPQTIPPPPQALSPAKPSPQRTSMFPQQASSSSLALAHRPIASPPPLSPGFDYEMQTLINELSPITIITVSHIQIGTWKRVALPYHKYSLVTYICPSRHCLAWYVQSGGLGFKMEVPFRIIVNTHFQHLSSGVAMTSIVLSQPPAFFLQQAPVSVDAGTSASASSQAPGQGRSPQRQAQAAVNREWTPCGDWTENKQGTLNLVQQLVGPTAQMVHLARTIHNAVSALRVQSQQQQQQQQQQRYRQQDRLPEHRRAQVEQISISPYHSPDLHPLERHHRQSYPHPQTPQQQFHPPQQLQQGDFVHSPMAPTVPAYTSASSPLSHELIDQNQQVQVQIPTHHNSPSVSPTNYHSPAPVKPRQMEPVIYYQGSDAGGSFSVPNPSSDFPRSTSLTEPYHTQQSTEVLGPSGNYMGYTADPAYAMASYPQPMSHSHSHSYSTSSSQSISYQYDTEHSQYPSSSEAGPSTQVYTSADPYYNPYYTHPNPSHSQAFSSADTHYPSIVDDRHIHNQPIHNITSATPHHIGPGYPNDPSHPQHSHYN